ncbi:MAG: valine--tRNA ligase [Pseudomonadota bacterium]|nr:valine--tRNA ligase [Pseudomonadota bacterium]
MNSEELSDRYAPEEVESRIYKWWEERGFFNADDASIKPPYCIILPPPNVTGSLHLGHALDHSIQDCLIRWKRMSGFNALWLPGTDHAGIATQNVVEKELKKEKLTRQILGREKFLERVWAWKDQYGSRIIEQMKRLGDSCDWRRHVFTMDESVSRSVRKVFVTLYQNKKIYQGERLINWCPRCETALSDLEVEHRDSKGSLWHIAYPIIGTMDTLIVATTRPETMLGDAAICVHPDDVRYKDLIGKIVQLPLTDRQIPIIADKYVDQEFGSGALKITPAHDFNDYKIGQTHKLAIINILTPQGTLNDLVPEKFRKLSVPEARKKIVEALKEQGFLKKEEGHNLSVGRCSRCESVVEPFLSKQWFVAIQDLAAGAKRVVENGTTSFVPENWTKTYLHWLGKIEDWCISRQLWWGHRIPAWSCAECKHVTVSMDDPSQCESCGNAEITQDEDVLDTWFSSALWPFSTLGWPDESEALKTFYPTDVLVTGHDIIFFWVARMIMMGLDFKKDVPFRTAYIHGLIRDSQGRKMSKSLGNSVDPVEAIEKYGADALRFTLLSSVASGRDLKFTVDKLEINRNFMNKIWNATRFSLTALKDFVPPKEELPSKSYLSVSDQWITYRLGEVEKEMDDSLSNFKFSEAAQSIYSFVWHDFCDWYLEFIKPIIYGPDNQDKKSTQLVLAHTLNRVMRLLHPFVPFITEAIYQKLPIRNDALIIDKYPTPANDRNWLALGSEKAAFEMELVKEVITAIRNIRGENRIKPGEKITAKINPSDAEAQKILGNNKSFIMNLARLSECEIGPISDRQKCAVTLVSRGEAKIEVVVPLIGLVDFDEEINRIKKNIEKIQKEIQSLNKKLGNEEYVRNAPGDVVEKDRELVMQNKSQLNSLQESLARLQ